MSVVSIIVAGWIGLGIIGFCLLRCAITRGAKQNDSFANDPSVRYVLGTQRGLGLLLLTSILFWPMILLHVGIGFIRAMLDDLQAWRRRRKMLRAMRKLGWTLHKIVADLPESEAREKLVSQLRDLESLIKAGPMAQSREVDSDASDKG